MKIYTIFIVVVFLGSCSGDPVNDDSSNESNNTGSDSLDIIVSYESDTLVEIKEQVKAIEEKMDSLEVRRLNYKSYVGGAVTGYFDNNNLIKVESFLGGEFGGGGLDFYFENDTIICAIQYKAMFIDIGVVGAYNVENRTYFSKGTYFDSEFTIVEFGEDQFYNEVAPYSDMMKDIEEIKSEIIEKGKSI